jgi:hypothetical protein
MGTYIYPAPGVTGVEATLKVSIAANQSDTGYFLPALQDVTVNAANDVFTWTQLDQGSKLQIATTATNSLSMNLVLDQDAFFGKGDATAGTAEKKGVFGLSSDKDLVEFELFLGKTSAGGAGKTIKGEGYVTGLAPTVSADSPVWVSPITITVTGDYSIS